VLITEFDLIGLPTYIAIEIIDCQPYFRKNMLKNPRSLCLLIQPLQENSMDRKKDEQDKTGLSLHPDLRQFYTEDARGKGSDAAKTLLDGQILRRDVIKWGLLTAGGIIAPVGGLIGCGGNRSSSPSPVPEKQKLWVIKAENAKPGTSSWRNTHPARAGEIQGFASLTSVNRGEDIAIFVDTAEPTYEIEVFRMGWYQGEGGRAMMPSVIRTGTKQSIPVPQPHTHLLECQWDDPYTLHIPKSSDPTDWASGVYIVKLTGRPSGKQSYVSFVVRDDERPSDLLFQSSVTTYAAYNAWGGWSLYTDPQAYAVSFNRPYQQGFGAGEFFMWEYNMVRFLEREGYDVTYWTDVDTHTRGQFLPSYKGFLSVGHDEYWSWQMRDNVEAARDSGVSLGFFGANPAFFQIRFQPDSLSGLIPNRTVVCYKNGNLDPASDKKNPPEIRRLTTTEFRLSPVNRPEDAMVGVMYRSFFDQKEDMVVEDASSWVFENTGLRDGDHLPGLLGYEADQMFGNAPPGTKRIAHSPYRDFFGASLASDMVFYTWPSGSTVVATGSMQWSWGLDDFDGNRRHSGVLPIAGVQQATRNILRRFGATMPAHISLLQNCGDCLEIG
jgi:hypothetical protein